VCETSAVSFCLHMLLEFNNLDIQIYYEANDVYLEFHNRWGNFSCSGLRFCFYHTPCDVVS
jgi:hypothetical protein